jgi:hypothetical protein
VGKRPPLRRRLLPPVVGVDEKVAVVMMREKMRKKNKRQYWMPERPSRTSSSVPQPLSNLLLRSLNLKPPQALAREKRCAPGSPSQIKSP